MENLRSIEARNRLFNFTFDVVKWFKYKSVDVKNFWKRRKKKKFWKNEKDIASRLFLSDPPYTQTNAKSVWITFFGSNTTVILLKQKKKEVAVGNASWMIFLPLVVLILHCFHSTESILLPRGGFTAIFETGCTLRKKLVFSQREKPVLEALALQEMLTKRVSVVLVVDADFCLAWDVSVLEAMCVSCV